MIEMLEIDCMGYMATCKDNTFDLAIVDPPYGIGEHGGKDRRGKSKHVKKDWDNERPSKEYFKELSRVSRDQIIWGGNYFTSNLQESRCWVAWDKKLYNSDFSDFELAWLSFDRGTKIFTLSKNGGSRTPEALAQIIHPTQKPVALYRWLLENYAKPNDLILDTHSGSFSSAVACKEKGFSGVFCEIDKDYFRDGKSRVDKSSRQYELIKPEIIEPVQQDLL